MPVSLSERTVRTLAQITVVLIKAGRKKIKQFSFKLYSSNDPFILLYYFN